MAFLLFFIESFSLLGLEEEQEEIVTINITS